MGFATLNYLRTEWPYSAMNSRSYDSRMEHPLEISEEELNNLRARAEYLGLLRQEGEDYIDYRNRLKAELGKRTKISADKLGKDELEELCAFDRLNVSNEDLRGME